MGNHLNENQWNVQFQRAGDKYIALTFFLLFKKLDMILSSSFNCINVSQILSGILVRHLEFQSKL